MPMTNLQSRLREIADSLLCRGGVGHYCPNCDNTTFDAAMSLKLLADQLGSAVEPTAPRERDARDFDDGMEVSILKAQARSPRRIEHTTEDDFQHFLSYSGKRGQPNEVELRETYFAGADVSPARPLTQPEREALGRAAERSVEVIDSGAVKSTGQLKCPVVGCVIQNAHTHK